MVVIDSDTHVIETEHTWDYMDSVDEKYRPQRRVLRTEPDLEEELLCQTSFE